MIEPKEYIKNIFRMPSWSTSRVGKVVRLDKNERTIPFPEEHLKSIWDSISAEDVCAYPKLEPFYEKLSKWLEVGREQVLLTSGSDTAIRAVYEVYVGEGDEVVMFPPTYGMYQVYCDMFGGMKKEVFYNEDFLLPVEKALSAIGSKTKLVVIANPNHTNTSFKESELIEILTVAKNNDALVLVDEAYYHFYEKTMLSYINEFDNLIIVRTFSKAFGVASLRIGYLVSNKDIITQLYKVKLTHEISGVSARFGEYLLDHLEIMENYVKDVKKGVGYLIEEFKQLGVTTSRTCTNFLFVKLPSKVDSEKVVGLLKEKNFYISGPFSSIPLKGFVRITVGPLEQMRDFISVFKRIYEKEYSI